MMEPLYGDEFLTQSAAASVPAPRPGRLLHFPTTNQPDNGAGYVSQQQQLENYRELQAELEPLPFGRLSLTTDHLDFTSNLAIEALAHQTILIDGLLIQLTRLAIAGPGLTHAELCRQVARLAGEAEKAKHQKLAATSLALELTIAAEIGQAVVEEKETVSV